jgi:polysaccharide pyruvyl transferase WcaK-like protein
MAAVATELSTFPPGAKIVGINLRDSSSYGSKYPKIEQQHMAAFLDDIGRRHNLHFLFIPISRDAQDNDLTSAKSIIGKMDEKGRARLVEENWDAEQTRHLIGKTDLALGISYHFLLFALSAGTPALGLSQNPYYRQKLSGLFRLYNCPDWAIELSADNPSLLTGSFDQLVKQKEEITALLEADRARVHALFTSGRKQLAEALRNTIEED